VLFLVFLVIIVTIVLHFVREHLLSQKNYEVVLVRQMEKIIRTNVWFIFIILSFYVIYVGAWLSYFVCLVVLLNPCDPQSELYWIAQVLVNSDRYWGSVMTLQGVMVFKTLVYSLFSVLFT
jgi:hypothetical protein